MLKKYGAAIIVGCFICLVALLFMVQTAIEHHQRTIKTIYKIEGSAMHRCDAASAKKATRENSDIDISLYEHYYQRCIRNIADYRSP